MPLIDYSSVFTGLSALGFVLMWGIMSFNGGSEAMLNTAWTGVFPDGSILHTEHSGIWSFDFQLNTLIAFFSSVSNLRDVDAGPYLMVLDLTTSILVINLMVLVESRRRSGFWLRSATLWILLCNCFGTAVFFPLWAHLYVKQLKEGTNSRLTSSEARVLPVTALIGILLEVPLVAPAWVDAGPKAIQQGVLLFFLGLPFLSIFQTLASRTLPSSTPNTLERVKMPFYITGILSSAVHIYSVAYSILSPSLSLTRTYAPDHATVEPGSQNLLTEAAHLFLQYDYIIVGITVFFLGRKMISDAKDGSLSTLFTFIVVFGPGAGLAYAACCSENYH